MYLFKHSWMKLHHYFHVVFHQFCPLLLMGLQGDQVKLLYRLHCSKQLLRINSMDLAVKPKHHQWEHVGFKPNRKKEHNNLFFVKFSEIGG